MTGSNDSADFYDGYVDRQMTVGVNERHHAILAWLERFGLSEGQRVLEIGSGVGTLTGLLADALGPEGRLVGTDLSPKSIAAAEQRLASFTNVELLAGDILDLDIPGTFDVVVLPDVIEHIPLGRHPRLFRRVASWLDVNGFALLHYPNPHFLAWCRENRPELLQHIDQPIHADVLTANVYAAGLYLEYLETYAIWVEEGDYQVAVLRHLREGGDFTFVESEPSLMDRIRQKIGRLLR